MNFNDHSKLKGYHAFLGASNPYWLNYDETKLATVYNNLQAKEKGTELHELACKLIELGQKLPKSSKTLNMYVNDAIGYRMTPEQVLYYSENCFGTADAITFRGNQLRVHDLKTGVGKTHMEQLMIYAALFCLEYHMKPENIDFELRIYQNDDIEVLNPTSEDISNVMSRIVMADKVISEIKNKEV